VVPLFINIMFFIFLFYFKFLVQRTMDEIQIDFLTRKLIEADFCWVEKSNDYSMYHINKDSVNGDKNVSIRESEAILVIKRLQEQVYVNFFFLLTLYVPYLILFSKLSIS
jgi:hypothetical protein